MFKIEKKFLQFALRHIMVITVAAAVVLSLLLRYIPRFLYTGDLDMFLIPWYHMLKADGLLLTIARPEVNYNGLYLLLLWGFTALPMEPIVAIKLLSVIFDYLLAGALALCAWQLAGMNALKGRKWITACAFIMGILLPIPLLNSAFWGQCDSIYAFFALMGVYYILRQRYTLAFLFLAISLAFKAQMMFLMPGLIILYLVQKRFSLLQFLQGPALLLLLGAFIRPAGSTLLYGWQVYLDQVGTYPYFNLYYPNLYVFMQGVQGGLTNVGTVMAVAACLCMVAYILVRGYKIEGDSIVLLMVWSVMTCTCLLPAMHERYGFVAEMLVWVFFLARPSLRRFALAFSVNFISLMAYGNYLFQDAPLSMDVAGVLNTLVYVALTIGLISYLRRASAAGLPASEAGHGVIK